MSKYDRTHFERAQRQRARRVGLAADGQRHRMVEREHERCAGPQHSVHLAVQPVEVLDFADHAGREREVDRVGPEEREVADVALVPLDPNFRGLGELAGQRELALRRVDRDDVRALTGKGDRVLARAASEIEHPLARDVAAQAERRLARQVRPVPHGVGRDRIAGTAACGDAIPDVGVRHARIMHG